MTTNKNFRVKNGLEVGADGIKFADNTTMTTAPTGGGTSYDQDLNTTATVVFSGLTIANTTITTSPSNVKSLLLAEDATDEVGNTVTLNGSAAVSSAQVKYGSNSFYLPGTTSDYVSIANSSSFNLGSSDFAIDFWLYPLTDVTTGAPTIASRWVGSQWIIQGSGTANQYYALVQANGQQFVYFTVADNAWNHIAITRFGDTLNAYVDGVLQESNTTITGSANDSTGDILLGVNGDGPQQPFNGYIDNFRLTVGDKRFDGTFTPPLANEYTLDGGTTSTTTTNVLQVTSSTVKTFVGITFADDTVMTTAPSGTSYDQSLNTTDSVVFSGLRVNGTARMNDILADDDTQKIVLSANFTGEGSGGGGQLVVGSSSSDLGDKITLVAGSVEIQNLIYPSADGTSGQVLTTDGGGTLSWSTASGGGTPGATNSYTRDSLPTGSTGTIITISDSASDPNSATFDSTIAYWDPVDELWKYVFNNLEVQLPLTATPIDYLVVAGGGGGGEWNSGGGGAGGMLTGSTVLDYEIEYTVTVGAGGAGGSGGTSPAGATGSNGSDSYLDTIQAIGGGGGGAYFDASPTSGGSGGGAGWVNQAGSSGTAGQGNAGGSSSQGGAPYAGSGGGGAGAVGNGNSGGNGGAGGIGLQSSITGTATYYAGGGGAGGNGSYTLGGTGGGGDGGSPGNNGTANTGGGGGGGGNTGTGGPGGNGGSGVVIIRHLTAYSDAVATTGSPEITTVGDYRIYKWTTSGSITF